VHAPVFMRNPVNKEPWDTQVIKAAETMRSDEKYIDTYRPRVTKTTNVPILFGIDIAMVLLFGINY